MRKSRLVVELRGVFVPSFTSINHIERKVRTAFFDYSAARSEAVGWFCSVQNAGGLTQVGNTSNNLSFGVKWRLD